MPREYTTPDEPEPTAKTPERFVPLSLGPSVVRGGLLLLSAQIANRVAGTASVLVLAAILVPRDFGLVAVANLSLGLVDTLLTLGLGSAVQTLSPSERLDRAAIALALLVGLVASTLVVVGAPLLARGLGDARATPLIMALAPVLLLGRWNEVRRALVERGLLFRTTVAIDVASTCVGIVVALLGAAAGLAAWALIAQAIAAEITSTVALAVIPIGSKMPKFDATECRRIWQYGRELLGSSLFVFAYTNVDDFFVARAAGTTQLGLYGFAYRVSNTPTYFLTKTLNRVLVPTYAALRSEPARLRSAYRRAVRVLAAASGTLMFGILVHGPAVFDQLYHGRWDGSYAALQVLAGYGLARSVGATTGGIFLVSGHPALVRQVTQWQLLAMLVLLAPAYHMWELGGVALAATAPLVVAATYSVLRACRMISLAPSTVFRDVSMLWLIAMAANFAGTPVRHIIDGWAGLLLAGLVVSGVVIAGFSLTIRGDARQVLRGLRTARD